jgi:hypothetical protein
MSYVCPACGAESHHPEDERLGWCMRCNTYTRGAVGVAGLRLYHVAPMHARASIALDGLRGILPGVYLWPTPQLARMFADTSHGEEVWEVDAGGLVLRPGGPHSFHHRELWTPQPISPERLTLLEATAVAS